MTNTELSLDQLKSASGAGLKTHWKTPAYNLKKLANSGELFQKVKYVPGDMYRSVPGDMF